LLGSAQIRIEQRGEVVVFSGDYKTHVDPTCEPLEPLRCHTFITESTFGLPIYRWPSPEEVGQEINAWWRQNQERGRTSVIFAYALGKAQRVLAGLDATIGPVLMHGAVSRFYSAYERAGIALPAAEYAGAENSKASRGRALVVAPPSAAGTPWLRKFGPVSTAMASGWMQIRGARRRRSMDRGFVLSDHADWNGLIGTIRSTGAEEIWVTHGYTAEMVRWLSENGWNARAIATRYEGEVEDPEEASGTDVSPQEH
jgi:putative mRNA 3-end processing factor